MSGWAVSIAFWCSLRGQLLRKPLENPLRRLRRQSEPPGRALAEGENKVTVPTRFRGKGTLLVKGAEQSTVEYEITAFEVDAVIRTEGWVEAGLGVLTYAQSSSGVHLRLSDGQVVEVSVGSFTVKKSNPSRAELIVHGGLVLDQGA